MGCRMVEYRSEGSRKNGGLEGWEGVAGRMEGRGECKVEERGGGGGKHENGGNVRKRWVQEE